MSSINNLLQTSFQPYNQVGTNVPASKPGPIDHNVLHSLGLSANLLQNLRNDLSAFVNGSNPERALNNLMSGLQQISGVINARAKEWPSDNPMPEGGRYLVKGADGQAKEITPAKEWPSDKPMPEGGIQLVKGADGQAKEITPAKEWPSDKPMPEGGKYLVKGADGQAKEITPAKEWPSDKPMPEGGIQLVKGADGQAKEITPAKEWPSDKPMPEGGIQLVKGADGQAKEITPAKEWPSNKPMPEGGIHLVRGEDGQPKEVDTSRVPLSDWTNVPSSVQASADSVISNLKGLLDAEAAGGDISQEAAGMLTALRSLFGNANPTQAREAVYNSIVGWD